MPYEIRPEDENLGVARPGTRTPGGPAAPAAASGGGSAAGGPTQAPGSGSFVNFDRIFAANQGDAQNMASNVAQGTETKAQNAQNAVTSAETAYANAAQAGVTSPTTHGHDRLGNTWDVSKTPQGVTPNKYSTQAATYGGPTDFADYTGAEAMTGLRTGVQDASDRLNATTDPYGVQAIMQEQYGGSPGGYSQGMSQWDAALTSAAGGQQFEALRKKYAGLGGAMDAAAKRAADATAAAQAQVAANNAAAAGQVGAMNDGLSEEERKAKEEATQGASQAAPGGSSGGRPKQGKARKESWEEEDV